MSNLLNRFHTYYSALKGSLLSRGWIRSGFGFALIILVITALISAIGSQQDTQAASISGAANDSLLDRSKLPLDFQFIGQGRISGGTQGTWIVGGLPIRVDGGSSLIGDLHVGDFVTLSGRILAGQGWLADRIESAQEGASFFTFNGPLEQQKGSLWRVGGHDLIVDSGTAVDRGLNLDDLVLVTFSVLSDKAWLASEIKAFDPTVFEPSPTPEPTATPTETPPKQVTPKPPAPQDPGERFEEREDEGKREDKKKDKKEKKEHKHEDEEKDDD